MLNGGRAAVAIALVCLSAQSGDAQPSSAWGRIANPGSRSEMIIGSVFFAGPPNPAVFRNYTRHPLDPELNGWSSANVDTALRQVQTSGINTLFFSYWGHDGETDKWATTLMFSRKHWPSFASEAPYSDTEQAASARTFFIQAKNRHLYLAPLIEVSPSNPFYSEFPVRLENFVSRCSFLLSHFGTEPAWLRLFDRTGQSRIAIRLIETIHASPIDPQNFAAGFDAAAAQIESRTGFKVGFIIDPTPLPPYGSEFGPEPEELSRHVSILAIDPFNITSQAPGPPRDQHSISEDDRLHYMEGVMHKWSKSSIPFIAPLMPGYDAHVVFPKMGIYGFNAPWLKRQTDLALHYETAGISFDCWNGWTEGYAIPPSIENGDLLFRWAQETIHAPTTQRNE